MRLRQKIKNPLFLIYSKNPEFLSYINRYYPGQNFDRGDNLLADIAASAILLKMIARKGKIDLTKPLSTADVVYLRGGYNAGNGEPYRKAYLKGEGSRYMPFVYNYMRFEKGYSSIVNKTENEEIELGDARGIRREGRYDFEQKIEG